MDILADSQAPLIWLTQYWSITVSILLGLVIICLISAKLWIFPSRKRRLLRNRQLLKKQRLKK